LSTSGYSIKENDYNGPKSSSYLGVNEYITSPDGSSFHLIQLPDAILAVYRGATPETRISQTPYWTIKSGGGQFGFRLNTAIKNAYSVVQHDGNFCTNAGTDPQHAAGGDAIWCMGSHKVENRDYVVQVNNDGNVCVFPGQAPWGRGSESCCSLGESTVSTWCRNR